MLATSPLVSTLDRMGLLKYKWLSKVSSPRDGLGILLRSRKSPRQTAAMLTSTTATIAPALALEAFCLLKGAGGDKGEGEGIKGVTVH